MAESPKSQALVRTGIEGLDDILHGGLAPDRTYLVEGSPGSGKTTLATQYLMEGVRLGEPCLFVTLSESEEEVVKAVGRDHPNPVKLEGLDGLVVYVNWNHITSIAPAPEPRPA